VPLSEIRILLLNMFAQWGMPLAIRTDNGNPFGVPTRDVIPIMSLWLSAWGVTPILNRPRRPQDNAKVESNQGTVSRWAEVYECQNFEQMQERLDEACALQRDQFPVKRIGNVSRSEVFKDLYTIKRPFELASFDEQKAYRHLAQAVYPRKVSKVGAAEIYHKSFQVGTEHKGKIVFVKFDPEKISWLIFDHLENLIKSIPDPRFSRENLFNLTVCQ
jgi:transposase InsO family protein